MLIGLDSLFGLFQCGAGKPQAKPKTRLQQGIPHALGDFQAGLQSLHRSLAVPFGPIQVCQGIEQIQPG